MAANVYVYFAVMKCIGSSVHASVVYKCTHMVVMTQ